MRSAAWEGDWNLNAGWRYPSGSAHYAYDVGTPMRTKLYAPGDGVVIDCQDGVKDQPPGRPAGSGAPSNWIILKFKAPTGKYKGRYLYGYFQHLTKGGVKVKKGQRVRAGQVIGLSGNSGNTTGPHLHLVVLKPQYTMNRSTRYAYLSNPNMVAWPIIDHIGDDTIVVYADKLRPGVKDSKSVRTLRRALIHRGFMDTDNGTFTKKKPGNDYSVRVQNAVKKWQAKKGYRPDGVMGKPQVKEFFKPNGKVVVK